jgi:hypothetical protein
MHKTTKQLPNYASNIPPQINTPLSIDVNEVIQPIELTDISFYNTINMDEYSNKSIQDLSNVFIFPDENNAFSQFSSLTPSK